MEPGQISVQLVKVRLLANFDRAHSVRTASACSPALSAPSHGSVSSQTGSTGAVVSFSCDAGYSLRGLASSICQANGTWTNLGPVCQGDLVRGCGECSFFCISSKIMRCLAVCSRSRRSVRDERSHRRCGRIQLRLRLPADGRCVADVLGERTMVLVGAHLREHQRLPGWNALRTW